MPKPYRKYEPANGARQRQKLLREISREPRRNAFSPSSRSIRRNVGEMFGFEPLHALDPLEQRALQKKMHDLIQSNAQDQIEDALNLLNGRLVLRRNDPTGKIRKGRPLKITTNRMIKLFSDGAIQKSHGVGKKDDRGRIRSHGSISGFGKRNALGYQSEDLGLNPIDLARDAVRRKGGKIRMLDVGSENNEVLFEIKQLFGAKVETHALSPTDVARFPTDHYHMLAAEYLPASFREHYDLIVSNKALEYSIFPHRAIQNIADCLSPKGRAFIQWRQNTGWSPLAEKALRTSPVGQPTPEALRLAMSLANWVAGPNGKKFTSRQMKNEPEKRAADFRQKWPNTQTSSVQAMALLNQIVQLQKTRKYKIKYHSLINGPFGYLPGTIEITRIR